MLKFFAVFVGTNWASGLDADGHPKPLPERQPQLQGALAMTGRANWNAQLRSEPGHTFWHAQLGADRVLYAFALAACWRDAIS
ncbi:MAG TPA: hypothetical protein VHZ07_00485 [Bryobacteraceae bacterium]|nr:hypothetical protein [Bryobacteraceae bacterium]